MDQRLKNNERDEEHKRKHAKLKNKRTQQNKKDITMILEPKLWYQLMWTHIATMAKKFTIRLKPNPKRANKSRFWI